MITSISKTTTFSRIISSFKQELLNMNDKFFREAIHHTQINESHNETHHNRHKDVAKIIHVVNFVCFLQREFDRIMH